MSLDIERTRFNMVEQQVRPWDVIDLRVLDVLSRVRREDFVPADSRALAFADAELPIGHGERMMKPVLEGRLLQALAVQEGDSVLEIGTGSGYQSAVLAELGADVYTIERHQPLSNKAKKILNHFGYSNVKTFYGDGFKGLPADAPFDKILITAAAPEIPKELLKQLKVNGIMVIPFGEGDTQKMIRIKRLDNNEFEKETFSTFTFVPMLKGKSDH